MQVENEKFLEKFIQFDFLLRLKYDKVMKGLDEEYIYAYKWKKYNYYCQ